MPLEPAYECMTLAHWKSLPFPNDPGEFQEARDGTEESPVVWRLESDGNLFTSRVRFVDNPAHIGKSVTKGAELD